MANKTIGGSDPKLTVVTSAAVGDLIAIWRIANGDTRAITKENLLGGVLTGGGILATGGFTLTVPATGTALLGNSARTAWTPVPADFVGAVGSAGSVFGAYYTIGPLVLAFFDLIDINTSLLAGSASFVIQGLPFVSAAASSLVGMGYCSFGNITLSGNISPQVNSGVSQMFFSLSTSAAVRATLLVSALLSGSADIRGWVLYERA